MPQEQFFLSSNIQALARWIFADDPSQLTYEKLRSLHLGALVAGILPDRLPEAIAIKAKKKFLFFQTHDLAQQQTMQQIAQLLTQNEIPFCPIKGADLASRVYPSGALRTRRDLDVLIPQGHRKRVFAVLRHAGWQQPFHYFNSNHEAEMFRNNICLELHHKLPGFPDKSMPDVWQNTVETSPYCHHLSLEFNLLMLFQHAKDHQWSNAARLLADFGFLLKKEGPPDWTKIHAVTQELHLYDPALFFRTFPDFFPVEMMPQETFPPDVCAKFRRMLLAPTAPSVSMRETVLRETARFSPSWWKARLNGLRVSVVRYKTGNPRGNYLKLWRDYFAINGSKFWDFFKGLHKIRRGEFDLQKPDEKEIMSFLTHPKEN